MDTEARQRLGTLVLALGLAAGLSACSEPKSAQQPEPRPVRTQVVAYEAATRKLSFAGTVEPRYVSNLGFRTGGKVVSRMVDAGAEVVPGTELARLDPQDHQLQLRTAQAQVLSAEADLEKARADFERYRGLQSSPAFNKSVFDQRQAAYDMAQARLAQMRGQARMTENQLVYTSLKADAKGIVTAVRAEVGQVVSQGQTVFTIARTEELEISVNIPENRLAEAQAAERASVTLWAEPGQKYRARLREIAPAADPASRTYAVRFSLLDAPRTLQIGMSATLELERPEQERIAELPLSALFQDGQEPAVWSVDAESGRLTLKRVQVASFGQHSVKILSGIEAGELVVTAGVHKLDAAQRVRLMQAPRS